MDTQRPASLLTRRHALRGGLIAAGLAGLAACGDNGPQALAAAAAPTGSPTGTPHTTTRLTVSPDLSFKEMVRRYEKAVPPLPAAKMLATMQSKPFAAVKELLEKASPVHFFVFYTLDVSPFMNAAGHKAKCKTYLMGNPLVAETMYARNAEVMLYAPLRTVIFTDADGAAHLTVDRPSDLFGSFDDAHIAATGHTLDTALAKLLQTLKFPVPAELAV